MTIITSTCSFCCFNQEKFITTHFSPCFDDDLWDGMD